MNDTYRPRPPILAVCPHCDHAIPGKPNVLPPEAWGLFRWPCDNCGGWWWEGREATEVHRWWKPRRVLALPYAPPT